MKKLVKRDSVTGKETWCHYQEDGGFIFETVENVDNLIAKNKSEANEHRAGSLIGDTQKHHQKVAEIPASMYHQLIEQFGEPKNNPTAWKKWLNDYNNRYFRTSGGIV